MTIRLLLLSILLAAGCAPGTAPPPAAPLLDPGDPVWQLPAPERFRVCFTTSEGPFVLETHRAWAPRGVDRFYHLVRSGFFDDSRFYRVREGYIAQFGIPGDPRAAALWRSREIPDDPVRQSNTRGRVSYAMTGPDTRTTQLFVNLSDNPHLDEQGFAPIGEIVSGMEAVDRLHAGYGESAGGGMRGGQQGPIFQGGNAYLDEHFPELDRILSARILEGEHGC